MDAKQDAAARAAADRAAADREEERAQLESDVAAFLAEGGAIEEVPRGFRADPPKKPESNYGRGAI